MKHDMWKNWPCERILVHIPQLWQRLPDFLRPRKGRPAFCISPDSCCYVRGSIGVYLQDTLDINGLMHFLPHTAVRFFPPSKTGFVDSANRLINIRSPSWPSGKSYLVHCSSKGSRRPNPYWGHTQPVIRAIGVSHTACKDEFRQNLRSHS